MRQSTAPRLAWQRRQAWKQSAPQLPLSPALDEKEILKLLCEEGVKFRERLFTPLVTLWTFLWQVLSPEGSCREAVARLRAYQVAHGLKPCGADSGAYCKARGRLPERVMSRLAIQTGQRLSLQADWLWKGRKVKVADGSTLTLPDTAANQKAYPQQPQQKAGLGFPILRLVVVFCLAGGAAVAMATGRYEGKGQGEPCLLRRLLDCLLRGEVLLADRYFSSYLTLAMLQEREVDYVGRQHHLRKTNFRTGKRLGPCDHLVVWTKPPRPAHIPAWQWQRLPERLLVRELEVNVYQKGFRVKRLIVATTLLDPKLYSAADLALLYRARWHAELDLRSLKVTLGMDPLRTKTPEMARKELWMHLLAYNLLRTVMAQAASQHGRLPRSLSVAAARQAVFAFKEAFYLLPQGKKHCSRLLEALWTTIVSDQVGNRPDRVEPRAIKRRPKPHKLLTVPRQTARTRLRSNPCA